MSQVPSIAGSLPLSAPTHIPRLDDDLVAYARSAAVIGAKRVHVTDRCVERALARRRRGQDRELMRLQLRQRIECGRYRTRLVADQARVLPELPRWLVGQGREDAPYYLAFDGWLVLPLVFTSGSSVRFTAVTCLGRGLDARANAAARMPRRLERERRLAASAVVVEVAQHRRLRRKRRTPARRPPWPASEWDETGQ